MKCGSLTPKLREPNDKEGLPFSELRATEWCMISEQLEPVAQQIVAKLLHSICGN